MQHIPFTSNHTDHCTDKGFRFEFFCEKCHDGFMTEFKTFGIGTLNTLLDMGESLFGGFFHQASSLAQRVHSASWERAKDSAFLEAVEEAKKHFHRCSRCANYFCNRCWNPEQGLCTHCAPFLEQEIESARRQAAIEQAHEKVRNKTYVTDEDVNINMQVTCPECNAPTGKAKFCPNCGAKTGVKKVCSGCTTEMSPSVKFCPECGAKN